ncbi:hypothetical protein DY251_20920 [Mesorhizobium denitrificans]|uniref:Uncharacterized protein n=1 Tax=Mesorhizobium denitrificans TaxID=2294114 RepID=A0A371X1Z1_9HYPH|nr:hypothetical protein DY251_20920 [Mesorhizobium denitrificans]
MPLGLGDAADVVAGLLDGACVVRRGAIGVEVWTEQTERADVFNDPTVSLLVNGLPTDAAGRDGWRCRMFAEDVGAALGAHAQAGSGRDHRANPAAKCPIPFTHAFHEFFMDGEARGLK